MLIGLNNMNIICISDTHGFSFYDKVMKFYPIDMLIHAGDFSNIGTYLEAELFNRELSKLPIKHKIVVAGNHDFALQGTFTFSDDIIYLQDSSVTIEGYKIYGSPWSSIFFDWAFMLCYVERVKKWASIPKDVDILVTHSPPFGILDVHRQLNLGCEALSDRLKELSPILHVFGHIHQGHGITKKGNTIYVNASLDYNKNNPIMLHI